MVNQENEPKPDQQRRSVKHDIVPTWDEVHSEFEKSYPKDEKPIVSPNNVQMTMQGSMITVVEFRVKQAIGSRYSMIIDKSYKKYHFLIKIDLD